MLQWDLLVNLPHPWNSGVFETQQIGTVNYLVGPNGSGKSQFAIALKSELVGSRILGSDRLSAMDCHGALKPFVGDPFGQGYAKNNFHYLSSAGEAGSGIDAFVILENKMDVRVQIEATLSHLFDRDFVLEWDSGNLIPKAILRESGTTYRLDRDECHGIKELMVLLTHLYDDDHPFLIIDEPELNLHPQYQAFFMEEVHKIAGDWREGDGKKAIFLITHSPFILDLRTLDDVNSIISFSADRSLPKQIASVGMNSLQTPLTMVRRLNADHKQIFFSDNPIIVEGRLDKQLLEAMLRTEGVSIAASGSCLIDAGGRDEVTYYLQLCNGMGKKAHFIYDLDSLFGGNLRSCIRNDHEIQGFLVDAGLGNDFAEYFSALQRKLTNLIDRLLGCETPSSLKPLVDFLRKFGEQANWNHSTWAKARSATISAISRYNDDMKSLYEAGVKDVEGRIRRIVEVLAGRRIHLLQHGAIEAYLPSYKGNIFKMDDDAKRKAVQAEIDIMDEGLSKEDLASRYNGLYEVVRSLPSKKDVDFDRPLRKYLGRYIHELQHAIRINRDWSDERVKQHLDTILPGTSKLFTIRNLQRGDGEDNGAFEVMVEIFRLRDGKKRMVRIDHKTNAGMGDFVIDHSGT